MGTIQLPGGERVAFLFTVKQLKASGSLSNLAGEFNVPSYRGSSFLDPKGRGGSTGYDTAVALPARGDDEGLAKENSKGQSFYPPQRLTQRRVRSQESFSRSSLRIRI